MSALALQDEQALRAQLRERRGRLSGLEEELRAVDGDLEELATERQQHALVEEVCCALEKLDELGGAGLFWGDHYDGSARDEQLRVVRRRLDAFQQRLAEVEGRRQAVLEELRRERENAEVLEADLFDVEREKEQRKLDWVIEREISVLPLRTIIMPWSRGGEDDERFRKSLAAALLLSLLLGLVLPLIELPLPQLREPVEVPERLARLIREEPPPPPPPVVQPESKPDEPLVAEQEAPKPTSEEKPKPSTESKGILAFREKFSALAAADPTDRLGAQARVSNAGATPGGAPQRSMVATMAPGSSGGINVASLSRDLGGGGDGNLEGVQVVHATSSIGAVTGQDRPLSDGPGPARTDEEIQIVFDRHKAALYRIYNRELRRDPTLEGQIVLRLTIEPDGSVSLCEVHGSDMNAPALARQVVDRVRTFDFGAKEVPAVTILYPIDFLPAA